MTGLQVAGLGKRYGATAALVDINLDVPPGSRTAVVGPSGSGKTTLLRLIAGFERPDTGAILLNGVRIADPIAGVPPHRLNIGMVMQEGALFPHLNVGENIGFGVDRREDRPARVRELMELVGLERPMATRQPHQLSGGQQQRVALARALARNPQLVLLDEPFSALDSGLREQTRQATAQILSQAGITTILVTHDREEAMTFADQLVVFRGGRLVQKGRPRDLYLAPIDPPTAEFLGPAIILDAVIADRRARSSLGELPVDANGPAGPAKIMLRPEQIDLSLRAPDQPDSVGCARIVAIEAVGSTARVSLSVDACPCAEAGATGFLEISFVRDNRAVPPVGSTVSISISGAAHRFPR